MKCESCKKDVDRVDEADQCDDCAEQWNHEQMAYFLPLYRGERTAGLHWDFTDEGLEMRMRGMGARHD